MVVLAGPFAHVAAAAYRYRFDDVAGPSGRGAQWVVVTASDDTRGAPLHGDHAEEIRTKADLIKSRDYLYIVGGSGGGASDSAVNYIFLVHPETSVDPTIEFAIKADDPDTVLYTQDVTMGESSYQYTKEILPGTSGSRRFLYNMRKSDRTFHPGTERTYLRFQQNPNFDPSQTLVIPLLIASVSSGDAVATPLTFSNTLRNSDGNIVAYDRFTWDVAQNMQFGGKNDWVFVPLADDQITASNVSYELTTDITNYSGIRYALDRYDLLTKKETLLPARWAVDLPADVRDLSPDVALDELSHIPPGFITTYVQSYDVVNGRKGIFSMYSVDPAGSPYDLVLVHPSVFGVDLGSASGNGFSVNAFRPLTSSTEFLKNAANLLHKTPVEMPRANLPAIAENSFVTADAVATLKVNVPMQEGLLRSEDVTGILPLHVTFNLPADSRFVAPLWEDLIAVTKNSGDARELFTRNYALFISSESGNKRDLLDWLKSRGLLDSVVKVFADEKNRQVIVSFIVLLHDDSSQTPTILPDVTNITDFGYLAIGDGNQNDRWDSTFYITPLSNSFTNGSSSGIGDDETQSGGDSYSGSGSGGGGGCSAAAPLLAAALLGFALVRGKRG